MFKRNEFERVTPESVGISSKAIEWLLDQLESGFTEPHGLMIMRHGKICAEGWWNPFAPGIRHGQQSHSKTYAATAVGIAYTEGILSLDERLIDIFPEEAPKNPSENLKLLTIRDVLCMGCGMDEMPAPTIDWIHGFLSVPVKHKPGTTYMYNSTGSSLLGAIVRKKTGIGLHEYLKPRLYEKIGIFGENHRWIKMPDGMEAGGYGLFATTEDNLRLMKLYADDGVWNGERILAADYVKMATSLQNESATESNNNPEATDNFLGYGFQIWMCRPKGVYRADGAMGQFTIVVPDRDMIIAITENASGAHWAQKSLDVIWDFLDKISASDNILKEDREASGHLKRRMDCLALPRLPYAPYSSLAKKINDREFIINKGALDLNSSKAFGVLGFGLEEPSIEKISFHFNSDNVVLSYFDGQEKQEFNIALDGSSRWNVIGDSLISQALCSGRWLSENILEITIRWVETCNERTIDFTFDREYVRITIAESTMDISAADIIAK